MQDINVISLDLTGRDLSSLTNKQQAVLAAPADNLPLAASVEVLAEIIRRSVNQRFAFRVPDDARLLAVWHQAGAAAVVSTYWRRKLAHIDIVIAQEADVTQLVLVGVPFRDTEIEAIRQRPRPLLVRCRVRMRVPAIAEVLGMIGYVPAMLDAASAHS
ncbi:MAG TPA: hypothetical protein VHS31_12065 [Tepidisphaeraceae bacterium]|nr:hypothetical protein [Tepidisphaeraceae bacterium]